MHREIGSRTGSGELPKVRVTWQRKVVMSSAQTDEMGRREQWTKIVEDAEHRADVEVTHARLPRTANLTLEMSPACQNYP